MLCAVRLVMGAASREYATEELKANDTNAGTMIRGDVRMNMGGTFAESQLS